MNKHLLLTLFLLISIQTIGIANDVLNDSLKTILATTKNDTLYIETLNKLSKELRWSDPVSSLDYAVKAEKTSEKLSYKIGLALAYHNIGTLYSNKRNNELALEYFNKSLILQKEVGNEKGVSDAYGNIGLVYRRLRLFDKALDYHEKSLSIKQKLNDSIGIAYSYGNIGVIFTEQGKYDKALIHFYKSLRIKESLNDTYGIANSYGNIGIIYLKISSLDQARISLERSLTLFDELNNKMGIAISSLHLGEIFFKQKHHQKSIKAYQQSLDIYTEQGNIKGIADAYHSLGLIYYALGNDTIARNDFRKSLNYFKRINNNEGILTTRIALAKYYKKYYNYTEATRQLRIAIKLANEGEFLAEENEALNILADILIKEENYIEASHLLVKARAISDSLFNDKLVQEVTQITMQHNFDNQLKDKAYQEKAERLTQDIKLKKVRYSRNILIIGFILVIVIGLILYRNTRIISGKNLLLEKQKQRISNQVNLLNDQKLELERANKTKDKFISIIGHDLRNPFNAINTFVSLVTEQLVDFDQEVFSKYLSLIKEAGNNAQNLLENLLEWALSQRDDLKAQTQNILINSILKGNLILIREIAYHKNISLAEELDVDVQVNIDKNMINTVVRNLLSNAIKFTPEKGKISIKSEVGQDEVKIMIEDTGIGINHDQIQIILKADLNNDENDSSNAGLGIILCHEFLQHHNQKLNVTSHVGNGTTFWFYLPIVKEIS